MEWFLKIIRIAGVSFPGPASFVQLQAELTAIEMENRLQKLEDPISFLHEDIHEISKTIYQDLSKKDSVNVDFDEKFYTQFRRGLAVLNSQDLLSLVSVIGSIIPRGINLKNPFYIAYMSAIAENHTKMEDLVSRIDNLPIGKSLEAEDLKKQIGIPKYVIRAIFQLFESKGYGFCSGGNMHISYTANV